jgi:hypothetical protein
LIHATNVTGSGAQQVVVSVLDALAKSGHLRGSFVEISEVLGRKVANWLAAGADVRVCRRALPNSISRLGECLFVRRERSLYAHGLVLGDIPLPKVQKQTVLVHQPNLISPEVNTHSSRKLHYRVLRWVFRRNIRFADTFVVQTPVMRDQMLESFPALGGRVVVMPQPAPDWLKRIAEQGLPARAQRLRLFYPAAAYPHKNHILLKSMESGTHAVQPIELTVTLNPFEAARLGLRSGWVRNAGRVEPSDCLELYKQSDGLFFPSLLESYGLPLVEAMMLGLPVVCSDLAYARWLCGEQAIYFDPLSPTAAWEAIGELQRRLDSGWQPDWSQALSKLPNNWEEVAQRFLAVMAIPIKGTSAESGQ